MKTSISNRNAQNGVVLVTGLIFLVVLTILGITAMQMSTFEEKMAGNSRDGNLAFQAAEAALRDAEKDILCTSYGANLCSRTYAINGMEGFDVACTQGLCDSSSLGYASTIWTTINWNDAPVTVAGLTDITDTTFTAVSYGRYTMDSTKASPPAIQGVVQQPRYIIEGFKKTLAGEQKESYYYRITAKGYGASVNSVVTLQEIFTP